MKLLFYLIHLLALKVEQILNTFDLTVKHAIFCAVFNAGEVAFILEDMAHFKTPFL